MIEAITPLHDKSVSIAVPSQRAVILQAAADEYECESELLCD